MIWTVAFWEKRFVPLECTHNWNLLTKFSLANWLPSLSFSAQLYKKFHMPSKLSACISLNKLSKILWVQILTLGPQILMVGRWAGMAASCLHQPSKSHRGIAKKNVQVNSLHQINIKTGIRTMKDFFKHSTYLHIYIPWHEFHLSVSYKNPYSTLFSSNKCFENSTQFTQLMSNLFSGDS